MRSYNCPQCNNENLVEDRYLGKKILCPHCHNLFIPPFPQSGLGVVSVLLGLGAIVIEIAAIVFFQLSPSWELDYAAQLKVLVRFLGFLGFIMTWGGIACAVMAFQRKKRRKTAAKWGLIVNILPNLFCLGYFSIKPFLPREPIPEPEVPEEETTSQVSGVRGQESGVRILNPDS